MPRKLDSQINKKDEQEKTKQKATNKPPFSRRNGGKNGDNANVKLSPHLGHIAVVISFNLNRQFFYFRIEIPKASETLKANNSRQKKKKGKTRNLPQTNNSNPSAFNNKQINQPENQNLKKIQNRIQERLTQGPISKKMSIEHKKESSTQLIFEPKSQ